MMDNLQFILKCNLWQKKSSFTKSAGTTINENKSVV